MAHDSKSWQCWCRHSREENLVQGIVCPLQIAAEESIS